MSRGERGHGGRRPRGNSFRLLACALSRCGDYRFAGSQQRGKAADPRATRRACTGDASPGSPRRGLRVGGLARMMHEDHATGGLSPWRARRGSLLRSIIRTLAELMNSRGASWGANGGRHRATPGHIQPLSVQLDSPPGHTRHRLATARRCLLSSRPQVRILLGRQCDVSGHRSQVSRDIVLFSGLWLRREGPRGTRPGRRAGRAHRRLQGHDPGIIALVFRCKITGGAGSHRRDRRLPVGPHE